MFPQPKSCGHATLLEAEIGIPLILDGLPAGNAGQATTLAELLAFLKAPPATADGTNDWRIEATRRLLALGVVAQPLMRDDFLVNPAHTTNDPQCADAGLAFARAVSAVDRCQADVLARIVARHLTARSTDTAWLRLLLEDEAAACLLVNSLARSAEDSDSDESTPLLQSLLSLYTLHQTTHAWPPGPLHAVCMLALLLQQPDQTQHFAALQQQLTAWPGWRDETAWPIRLEGGSLTALQQQLTDRLEVQAGCADQRLWPRAALPTPLAELWPPLVSFCWHCPPRRPTT